MSLNIHIVNLLRSRFYMKSEWFINSKKETIMKITKLGLAIATVGAVLLVFGCAEKGTPLVAPCKAPCKATHPAYHGKLGKTYTHCDRNK